MIKTPDPKFDSQLTEIILELEHLKDRAITSTTSTGTFLQLKNLLHAVEAVASSRIEGNRTTIASYLEKRDDIKYSQDQQILEISNLINGLDFIDQYIMDEPISTDLIRELHRIVVDGLTNEGDTRAGAWRIEPRYIANAKHQPPEHYDVPDLMRELVEYINTDEGQRYNLLKIAIAAHRFVWIHPFGNGNGRTDRLLTYALLCKQGYIAPNKLRLFNPTAVFAGDREKYYDMLDLADDYRAPHILLWCEYFLGGVRDEIKKSQQLADQGFVTDKILNPAINAMFRNSLISSTDAKILRQAAKLGVIKTSDLKDAWSEDVSRMTVSRHINKLRDSNLLRPTHEGARTYELNFSNSGLTRITLEQMDKAGLLPMRVDA